jgi:hypothetical protein
MHKNNDKQSFDLFRKIPEVEIGIEKKSSSNETKSWKEKLFTTLSQEI